MNTRVGCVYRRTELTILRNERLGSLDWIFGERETTDYATGMNGVEL